MLFVFAIIIIFALLGLSELIHIFHVLCVKPKGKRCTVCVVFLKQETAVQDLYSSAIQSAWLGKTFCEYRIAVYETLENDTYNICKRIADKYDYIFCPGEVLESVITALSNNCS